MSEQAQSIEQLEFVDLRREGDRDLLAAIHRDLFRPNFPDPDEQEEPDDWEPRLWGNPEPPQARQHGFVAGTQLTSPEHRWLAGFAFVEHYRRSRTALLSYIAVDKSSRVRGLGRELLSRSLSSVRRAADDEAHPLRAVFAEIHDPRRVSAADDVIDPADRVRIMHRLGGWRVPVTYVQPALGPDSQPSHKLMLIAFPLDDNPAIEVSAVTDFLAEYYAALGIADPLADPDLTAVEKTLAALGSATVDLVPLVPE